MTQKNSKTKQEDNKDTEEDSSRRKKDSETLDIDRRQNEDRRESSGGRGQFSEYFRLYNMIYESHRVSSNPETMKLMTTLISDQDWQVAFTLEASNDRIFNMRKNIDEFRSWLLNEGALEDEENQIYLKFKAAL